MPVEAVWGQFFLAGRRNATQEGTAMVDRLDRKILQILQEDATVPVAEIGRRVGLSTTPCWRRIQKLEEDGVIVRRAALLDPKKINTKVTAFVAITTNQHNEEWLKRFAEVIQDLPEVVEFYRMAGQVDYLLRVVVPDIEAYDNLYKRLIAKIDISDVSTTFAMEQIKYTTALPLNYIVVDKEKAKASA
jgi:Lrp/AsnC family transcriptional regulator